MHAYNAPLHDNGLPPQANTAGRIDHDAARIEDNAGQVENRVFQTENRSKLETGFRNLHRDEKNVCLSIWILIATNEVPAPRKPGIRRRYSIGEWYGVSLEKLTPQQRLENAKLEIELDALTGKPCPFHEGASCNKKGGVCSLRLYEQKGDGVTSGVGPLITTCPIRLLERNAIFEWVGETILQTPTPVVLDEIGFLDRLQPDAPEEADEEDSKDFIGRIDNVLVHPSHNPIDWCALELQAVYFSGKAMKREFLMLSAQLHPTLPFPAAYRRPDWRSSGPKRLLPQLQTKVPTIRTWGKKMAVVIDEAFFSSLVGLERERHLSNAEIVWFVVGYDAVDYGWQLTRREVVFTKLDASVEALTGGIPLSKERFEAQLLQKLSANHPNHPLTISGS